MCGQFKLDVNDIEYLKTTYNLNMDIKYGVIKPSEQALVMVKNDNSIVGKKMIFGWNERNFIINARSETFLEKPIFKKGKRCVIPVSTFYEWDYAKNKVDFYSDKILFLAGIYHNNEFIILTTKANNSMIKFHDRMPLILDESQLDGWFDDRNFISLLRKSQPVLKHYQKIEQLSLF